MCDLIELAQAAEERTNLTAEEMLSALAKAMQKDFEKVYQEYADAASKSVSELTSIDKQIAVLNHTIGRFYEPI